MEQNNKTSDFQNNIIVFFVYIFVETKDSGYGDY